jgi:surface-anchored protein
MRTMLSVLAIALPATLGLISVAQAANVWTAGHGDLRLTYEAGELHLFYRLDGSEVNGVYLEHADYEFSDLITYVPDSPIARPAGATWEFVGNAAGEPIWYIDFTQLVDRPWPGISTELLSPADFTGNLTYSLTGFSGPGQFSLVDFGPFGDPHIFYQTSNGVDANDVIAVPAGAHAHYAWLFTEPGVYALEITASGNLAGGGSVSATEIMTMWVAVPEPASAVTLAISTPFAILARRVRRR